MTAVLRILWHHVYCEPFKGTTLTDAHVDRMLAVWNARPSSHLYKPVAVAVNPQAPEPSVTGWTVERRPMPNHVAAFVLQPADLEATP